MLLFSGQNDPSINSQFLHLGSFELVEYTLHINSLIFQVAMATGQVMFQRFYYSKSFVKHNMEVCHSAL